MDEKFQFDVLPKRKKQKAEEKKIESSKMTEKTEQDENVSLCLMCGGECNMHSQLCSFCMRKGIVPE